MSATDTEQRHKLIPLLGPAFVAAVAYVDPGNVAANITAGARYGYLLVWVLVASNIFAMVIQYLSAKLGLVTGQSLPALLGARMGKPGRIAFWLQAEIVAAATDLAEVIGGALAPIAAQALTERGGLNFVGGYLVAAGLLSLAGLALMRGRSGDQA